MRKFIGERCVRRLSEIGYRCAGTFELPVPERRVLFHRDLNTRIEVDIWSPRWSLGA
ncbi:hypothetical protein ACNKHQ_19000 [Shigella flexneri]